MEANADAEARVTAIALPELYELKNNIYCQTCLMGSPNWLFKTGNHLIQVHLVFWFKGPGKGGC